MGKFTRILREIATKPADDYEPSLAEVYKAGRSMGLDAKDVARIYKGSKLTGVKGFFSKHWWVFLLVTVISIGVIIAIVAGRTSPPNSPFSQYPAGTRYGAISIKDFKKSMAR